MEITDYRRLLCLRGFAGVVSASIVTPIIDPNNPVRCDNQYIKFESDGTELPLLPRGGGTQIYSFRGGRTITITTGILDGSEPDSLDWTSNFYVDEVIVKGGPLEANRYIYSPNPVMGDTYLNAPPELNQ
jgi:hypothetical protein